MRHTEDYARILGVSGNATADELIERIRKVVNDYLRNADVDDIIGHLNKANAFLNLYLNKESELTGKQTADTLVARLQGSTDSEGHPLALQSGDLSLSNDRLLDYVKRIPTVIERYNSGKDGSVSSSFDILHEDNPQHLITRPTHWTDKVALGIAYTGLATGLAATIITAYAFLK